MVDETNDAGGHDEERRKNRPYRRLVGMLFGLAILGICVLFMRGIIRALDRLPSASVAVTQGAPDVRALAACAEDLEKLERRIRKAAASAFSETVEDPREASDWHTLSTPLTVERLNIVARCNLDNVHTDNALDELRAASNEIEALLRSYALLHDRYLQDGLPHALEARRALRRAILALEARAP